MSESLANGRSDFFRKNMLIRGGCELRHIPGSMKVVVVVVVVERSNCNERGSFGAKFNR
jgi:hypothetical protein